jgi:hypothetical protein
MRTCSQGYLTNPKGRNLAMSETTELVEPDSADDHEARVEAERLERHPRLKRMIARLCGCQEEQFVLQVVQPSLVGMIDGTVSTLAPIFAAAVSSSSKTALLVGLATALGAGVSMGISEALSDTGEETGRGSAVVRGMFTGGATTLGGVFHSLPFIISDVHTALVVAGIVVAFELLAIAWVRSRFLHVTMRSSLLVVTLGGALVLAIGVAIGSA